MSSHGSTLGPLAASAVRFCDRAGCPDHVPLIGSQVDQGMMKVCTTSQIEGHLYTYLCNYILVNYHILFLLCVSASGCTDATLHRWQAEDNLRIGSNFPPCVKQTSISRVGSKQHCLVHFSESIHCEKYGSIYCGRYLEFHWHIYMCRECVICVSAWLPSMPMFGKVFLDICVCGSHVVNTQGCLCEELASQGGRALTDLVKIIKPNLSVLAPAPVVSIPFPVPASALPSNGSPMGVALPNLPMPALAPTAMMNAPINPVQMLPQLSPDSNPHPSLQPHVGCILAPSF